MAIISNWLASAFCDWLVLYGLEIPHMRCIMGHVAGGNFHRFSKAADSPLAQP